MRADLLALTPDTLAELTNRGLVKRATREVERESPAIAEDPDGTVTATASDGTTTSLPPGGLEAGKCSCGAPGVCRHIVGLVLAYQTWQPGTPPANATGQADAGETPADPSATPADPSEMQAGVGGAEDGAGAVRVATGLVGSERAVGSGWSPGEFSDAELEARIGERMMAAARRVERGGFVARVHRGRVGDPVPTVELPTATVRFLVPGNLGFARTDAVAGVRDDVIALAVWAFRAADSRGPGVADLQVQVGGGRSRTAGAGAALERAVALAGLVLREGAVHLGAGIGAEVSGVRRELEAARMRWPLLAVDDLVAQLGAYRDRTARYRPEALAEHVAELFARRRTVTEGGASLASRVLGTDEAAETPLRRARLDGLGARVSAIGEERVVDVFLAHADSAAVLVLRRAYESEDPGPRLAERRVAGVTIGALAGGAVITESAARSASRTVRLGARRLSRTEAMASRGSWQNLPRALIAADLAALATELDALPPRPVRARVEAELVRVVPIAEVVTVRYSPGAQRLDAVIVDAAGTAATVTATHAACAPGRLDGVAAALAGEVRYVAGTVRRGGGGIVIDPIGFAVGDGVLVPDLSPAGPGAEPRDRPDSPIDPLGHALEEAVALLAEVAHRGLVHAPPTMGQRLRQAADRLARVGLRRAADATTVLAGLLGPDPGERAVQAWVDAFLRVSLSAELRG
jgi:hypothetical protein